MSMQWTVEEHDVGEILPDYRFTVVYVDMAGEGQVTVSAGGQPIGFTLSQATLVAELLNDQIADTEWALIQCTEPTKTKEIN